MNIMSNFTERYIPTSNICIRDKNIPENLDSHNISYIHKGVTRKCSDNYPFIIETDMIIIHEKKIITFDGQLYCKTLISNGKLLVNSITNNIISKTLQVLDIKNDKHALDRFNIIDNELPNLKVLRVNIIDQIRLSLLPNNLRVLDANIIRGNITSNLNNLMFLKVDNFHGNINDNIFRNLKCFDCQKGCYNFRELIGNTVNIAPYNNMIKFTIPKKFSKTIYLELFPNIKHLCYYYGSKFTILSDINKPDYLCMYKLTKGINKGKYCGKIVKDINSIGIESIGCDVCCFTDFKQKYLHEHLKELKENTSRSKINTPIKQIDVRKGNINIDNINSLRSTSLNWLKYPLNKLICMDERLEIPENISKEVIKCDGYNGLYEVENY